MVSPGQFRQAVGHAVLLQPLSQQLGLPRWNYLVVAAVGEEGRRIVGVEMVNGREVVVASGYGAQ